MGFKTNMFTLKCDMDTSEGLKISLYIEKDNKTLNSMHLAGKEKEYEQYLNEINNIIKPISKQINNTTYEFVMNNLTNDNISDEKLKIIDEQLKNVLDELAKCILGGKQ